MIRTIQHHDQHQRLLRIGDSGPGVETTRDALAEPPQDFGFYVVHEGTPIGVYAGADGPVIFHGADRYPLSACELAVTDEDDGRRFVLRCGNEERLSLRYAPPPELATHPYDSPEMADFYLWLSRL